MRWVLGAILATTFAGGALAQTSCGQFDFSTPYANAFLSGVPYAGAPDAAETITTMADGACHQDTLVARLSEALGPVAGYKAAATSAGAQKQLGLDGPVLGVLLDGMLRESGATIAIDEGARMIFELDLLARVADPEALLAATNRVEALAAIDAFIPFIELGDLMVPKGAAITGPLLQAMNAGARLGVVGAPLPTAGTTVEGTSAASGTLSLDGRVVAEAPAAALLGHPLDAVLWIADAVKTRGMTLEAGQVLSLGSMGRFQMAAPGEIVGEYKGFGQTPATVTLTLE
ncbi:MAG: fumarylacetoacetate hydrolase [Pseudomonadota bacterium]